MSWEEFCYFIHERVDTEQVSVMIKLLDLKQIPSTLVMNNPLFLLE